MSDIFIKILNMSLTASYVAFVVIILRLLLIKAPKIYSYCLWSAVLFRLICPVSFNSIFSLLSTTPNTISQDITYSHGINISSGMNAIDNSVNRVISALPIQDAGTSANPMQLLLQISSWIWILGVSIMICYAVISYMKIKNKINTAVLVKNNIYETDLILSPFVLGFVKPKIFIPLGFNTSELDYIIKHELTHIRRKDYLIKPLAFFMLSVYWFNPFMWFCFICMTKDMETSCDESVLKLSNDDIIKQYSDSILLLSAKQSGLLIPLAFGESNVKSRIRNVLSYKKPKYWINIVSIFAVIAAIVAMLSNPLSTHSFTTENTEQLIKYRTEYVGDNSKVGNIINNLHFTADLKYNYFELETIEKPYSLTINLKTKTETKTAYTDDNTNQTTLVRNAIIIFSLIKNIDYVKFKLDDDSSPDTIQFSRDVANDFCEGDIWETSASLKSFDDMISDLNIKYADTFISFLVDESELNRYSEFAKDYGNIDFIITASKIHAYYYEENKLKVFVTTYYEYYQFDGKIVLSKSGGIVPAAITYVKDKDSNYVLEKYTEAEDGTYFATSIKKYCTMPVSGKNINGLSSIIINNYSNDDLIQLQRDKLIRYMNAHNLKDFSLVEYDGAYAIPLT